MVARNAVFGVKLDHLTQLGIIRCYGAAFTSSDGLHRMEAKSSDISDSTHCAAIVERAHCMGCVLNEGQTVFIANLANLIRSNVNTAKVNSHNCFRFGGKLLTD